MNRFTLTKGSLVSGAIVLGTAGMAITYNVAGQRTSMADKAGYNRSYHDGDNPNLWTYTTYETELYSYTCPFRKPHFMTLRL